MDVGAELCMHRTDGDALRPVAAGRGGELCKRREIPDAAVTRPAQGIKLNGNSEGAAARNEILQRSAALRSHRDLSSLIAEYQRVVAWLLNRRNSAATFRLFRMPVDPPSILKLNSVRSRLGLQNHAMARVRRDQWRQIGHRPAAFGDCIPNLVRRVRGKAKCLQHLTQCIRPDSVMTSKDIAPVNGYAGGFREFRERVAAHSALPR